MCDLQWLNMVIEVILIWDNLQGDGYDDIMHFVLKGWIQAETIKGFKPEENFE